MLLVLSNQSVHLEICLNYKIKNKMKSMKSIKFNPEILVSSNYKIFKFMEGNRQVIPIHVKRLKRSFQDNGFLLDPILVNDKHEIIDGQNRFTALSELGWPIYYIKVYNYGLEEVKVLNQNQQKWKPTEHLDSFVVQGHPNYVTFKKFMNDFPKFSFATCVKILSGIRSNKSETIDGYRARSKDFESGDFEIPNIKKSYIVAKKIMDFESYFEKFHDTRFVITMLGLFEHPNYDHDEMLKKMRAQPHALEVCRNQDKYKELIEEIYNYKRREKVNLRF